MVAASWNLTSSPPVFAATARVSLCNEGSATRGPTLMSSPCTRLDSGEGSAPVDTGSIPTKDSVRESSDTVVALRGHPGPYEFFLP